MTMVEKAAHGIHRAFYSMNSPKLAFEDQATLWRTLAAGAIEAMREPTDSLHGFSIRWGDRTVSAGGFSTWEEMQAFRDSEFDDMAAKGWTQPRWWQFWRARDTRR
jgi:hypothetical protein